MQHVLDYQADQIELVLHNHRASGQVVGGVVTPRWIRYRIVPTLNVKVATILKLSEEIALRLGTSTVRMSRNGGNIHVEVPRQNAKPVRFQKLMSQVEEVPKQSAILGIDEEGFPLILRLPSPEVAHVLISGTTGSGKTVLAQTVALSLALHNRTSDLQMILIDPKGEGFGPLADLPHLLRPLVKEVHQAIFLMGELVEEMIRRDREGVCEPRIVVFVDELADLMDQGGNAMKRLLTRLTQRGRSAGIHIIACTQKPLADSIGSITRSNFPVRLVGSVTSPEDAKVASGIARTGAEKLLGRGDFLLVAKGNVRRFQAGYVSHREIVGLTNQMCHLAQGNHRWLADKVPIALANTGTDGSGVFRKLWSGAQQPGRLGTFVGTQLKLLKRITKN